MAPIKRRPVPAVTAQELSPAQALVHDNDVPPIEDEAPIQQLPPPLMLYSDPTSSVSTPLSAQHESQTIAPKVSPPLLQVI